MLWRKKFFIVRSDCTLLYHQELIHHVRLNQNLYSEFVWSSTAHSYTNQIMAWELNRLNLSTRVLSVSAALDPTNFTLSFNVSFYIFFQKFKLRETFSLGTGGRGGGAEHIYIYTCIQVFLLSKYHVISYYFILLPYFGWIFLRVRVPRVPNALFQREVVWELGGAKELCQEGLRRTLAIQLVCRFRLDDQLEDGHVCICVICGCCCKMYFGGSWAIWG
jgi:hypothetical protein